MKGRIRKQRGSMARRTRAAARARYFARRRERGLPTSDQKRRARRVGLPKQTEEQIAEKKAPSHLDNGGVRLWSVQKRKEV